MTAILRLQLDDKDPVRVNSAINQLAEFVDRGGGGGGGRTLLTANTTFYVATTGSDANPGTSGSPFLTIQHAYDVIVRTLDTAGFTTTISCASGTYTTGLVVSSAWSGGGQIVLDLGGGTLNVTGEAINFQASLPANFTIRNGTITASGDCIIHQGTGIVVLGSGVTFGTAGGAHLASSGASSKILVNSSYTISGGGFAHYLVDKTGNAIEGSGATVTITGTITFTNFVAATRLGLIFILGFTFPGSTPTAPRYAVNSNAVIFTNGGGANYFPGTSPGSSATGGLYL